MSEEQFEEKMRSQENRVLIILGIFLAVIWVALIVIDVSGEGMNGFVYFIYGILNIGAFLVYFRSKAKKSQEKWIKTNLFEEEDEKKAKKTS
jgi:uncharacterized membrane protein YsdA (DUF1294 family)